MQAPDFRAAVPPEMLELSASRQTWYVGQHAASHRTYWVYTPVGYQVGTAVQDHDERHGGTDLVADWSINPVRPVAGGMLAHVPRLP